MAQQIQELIDKIKNEGIDAAEASAKKIEQEAQKQAQQIIADAQQQAEKILNDAQEEIQKKESSSQMALRQSSRDLLLSLRKEIDKILRSIVEKQVKDAITTDALAGIIKEAVSHCVDKKGNPQDIQIVLSPETLEELAEGFIAKLQKQIKQPLKLVASDDMEKGFTISFDKGKSCFDFTDESLTEYLGAFLNAEVAKIVKESV